MLAWSFNLSGLWAGIITMVAGLVVMVMPRILNYIIGVLMIAAGIGWMISGGWHWLPGVFSLIFGILVIVMPNILNYLVGIYLIGLGVWFLFMLEWLVPGIVTIAFGFIVLVFPAILNYLFGIYLLVIGFLAIARYYGWF